MGLEKLRRLARPAWRTFAIGSGAVVALAVVPTTAAAQELLVPGDWRISAAAGAYAPRSAVIRAANGPDTRLTAGPSFALDVQYLAGSWVSLYGNAGAAFTGLSHGVAVQPAIGGSDQVMLLTGTAGVVLDAGAWLGERLQPTLRLGGGIKGYSFDMTGVDSQWRLTGDVGLGFRGIGTGPIDVSAEVRLLPSSFDQNALPIRGILAQEQRQMDLVFAVGVSVRP